MKTILVISPNLNDGVSFWRMAAPMLALEKQYSEEIRVILSDKIDWQFATKADILMINRPVDRESKNVIEYARLVGLPVWIDIDDDLFNVPDHNPSFRYYEKKGAKDILLACLNNADVVTVSTEYLGQDLKRRGCRTVIQVPNALNDYLCKLPWRPGNNKVVMWRGSSTHMWDLEFYKKAILKFANENPEWEFHFFGFNQVPSFITHYLPNRFAYFSWSEPVNFLARMYEQSPRMLIAPLHDDHFNRCKSNIAWQEATYVGATCVAPKWKEWAWNGTVRYQVNDVDSFYSAMNFARDNHDKKIIESYESLTTHRVLSKVNTLRKQIVDRLIEVSK